MMFSITLLVPLLWSFYYNDGAAFVFINAFGYTLAAGSMLWILFRHNQDEMRIKDGFLVTVMFYVALGSFGSIPFAHVEGIGLSIPDALFESFSGLTTTGATVITGLETLPKSILFYRQQLQWLGGMGIIVLAVAILPMLGVGGMQLYRAETPGPMKDSKLTPRIHQTALALWSIYLGLTASCALAYKIAGMEMFDAICHSFSTVAIGGFSTYDSSIGYFNSPAIETVAVVFMVVCGINFGLHFYAFKGGVKHYLTDDETRTYLVILGIAAILTSATLMIFDTYDDLEAVRASVFTVVSIFTTTGFTTEDFSQWPNMLPYMIFFGAFSGACAGSTGGGMKIMRVLLIWKQGIREVFRIIHPNALFPVKINHRPVSHGVIEAIWGFFSVYVILFITLHLIMMALGMDFLTAFSAVGACLNNLGPGLGDVAYHYGDITDSAKMVLVVAMMLGRLEIFTLLVLFTFMFWRK
ncbi:MAG: TrkH family potassium uptake protein [Candidatus Azotimanducaceae bacterium]